MNWRNLLSWDQQPAKMFEEQLQLLINNIYKSGVSGSPELSDCINVNDYKEIVEVNKVQDLLSFPDSFRINHSLFAFMCKSIWMSSVLLDNIFARTVRHILDNAQNFMNYS